MVQYVTVFMNCTRTKPRREGVYVRIRNDRFDADDSAQKACSVAFSVIILTQNDM